MDYEVVGTTTTRTAAVIAGAGARPLDPRAAPSDISLGGTAQAASSKRAKATMSDALTPPAGSSQPDALLARARPRRPHRSLGDCNNLAAGRADVGESTSHRLIPRLSPEIAHCLHNWASLPAITSRAIFAISLSAALGDAINST
jgi:hypothetical protein